MVATTDRLARDKLRVVHRAGFGMVTEVQMALIQHLDLQGARLATIAARANMTKQGMLELVEKMEALGFVARQPDPVDSRAHIVGFTPPGLAMLDAIGLGVVDAERRMGAAIGTEFVAEMRNSLSAYVASNVPAPLRSHTGLLTSPAWRARSIAAVVIRSMDVFARDFLDAIRAEGLADVQRSHLALFRNLDLEGTRLTTVAARARLTKQAMSQVADKAQALGYIERRPDPADRRASIVAFTPAGLLMLARFRDGIVAAERRMAGVTGSAFLAELKTRLRAYAEAGEMIAVDPVGSSPAHPDRGRGRSWTESRVIGHRGDILRRP